MNRKTPAKKVDPSFMASRLRIARGYLKAARTDATLAEEGDIGNPAMSHVVLAAIAFTDVLTAKSLSRVNKQDHKAAVEVLTEALGKRLPDAQKTHLIRILGRKDEVQYGSEAKSNTDAKRLLDHLEKFAAWAEEELKRP